MFLGIYPIKLLKGTQATIILNHTRSSNGNNESAYSASHIFPKVSKDGGAFTDATNGFVQIESGLMKLTLTATEMNADMVIVKCYSDSTTSWGHSDYMTIFTQPTTTPTSTVNFNPATLFLFSKIISDSYALTYVDTNNDGYNYYGFNKRREAWIIIREKTDGSEVRLTIYNESKMSFGWAWLNREELAYNRDSF